MLRATGYATMAVGKWHLCREADLSAAGDTHSWPLQRGFDQYYGFLEALTNFHHPHLMYEGNSPIHVDEYPEGYYLTDDLTDRACRMDPRRQIHRPRQAAVSVLRPTGQSTPPCTPKPRTLPATGAATTRAGTGSERKRLTRQKQLGVVPLDTELPPRNSEPDEDVAAWDSYPEDDRRVMARYMEVYAAMVESIDHSVARIRAELAAFGQLDNTIFVFTSDNGASREGRAQGTISYFTYSNPGAMSSAAVGQEEMDALEADTHRRSHHLAPLSPRVCHGLQHAIPVVQDHRPTGAAIRCPWWCRGPPRTHGGGRGVAPPVHPTSPTWCPPWPNWWAWTSPPSATGNPPTPPTACRSPPAWPTPTTRMSTPSSTTSASAPPGLLPRRLVGGHLSRVHDPVQRRTAGNCSTWPTTPTSASTWPTPSRRSWPSWCRPGNRLPGATGYSLWTMAAGSITHFARLTIADSPGRCGSCQGRAPWSATGPHG